MNCPNLKLSKKDLQQSIIQDSTLHVLHSAPTALIKSATIGTWNNEQ